MADYAERMENLGRADALLSVAEWVQGRYAQLSLLTGKAAAVAIVDEILSRSQAITDKMPGNQQEAADG